MFKTGFLMLLLLIAGWFSPLGDFLLLAVESPSQRNLSLIPSNYINIENFNLQSTFKLYNIFPYTNITRDRFDEWVQEQNSISFDKILRNIGDVSWSPELLAEKNVSLGAVIASPSTSKPNYFYQWIRDGAITINSVTQHLDDTGFQNKSLQITVENYLKNSFDLQRVSNPSGEFDDKLLNLGEPKFMVDGSPFTDHWGRPQNDGPALRVISIGNFLRSLEQHSQGFVQSDFKDFKEVYFKILKLDLQFIVRYWHSKNFDLWEEIDSHHFFTSLTQLKALKIGLSYAQKYDTDSSFITELQNQFQSLLRFILKDAGYVNYNLNHIVETPSLLNHRSGLDAAIIIASILTHDDALDDTDIPFNVNDGLILNTLSEMVKSMKYLYPINHDRINLNLGVALGRYPEDIYDGIGISEGNPWFLTTLYASELLFKLISKFYSDGCNLLIDESNQHFYFSHIIEVNSVVNSDLTAIDYNVNIPFNSIAFNQTMKNVFDYADSFLDVVRLHVSDDGYMSEQFNKYTGFNQGAENLTWSYGAYYNSFRWRERAMGFVNS